MTANETDEIRKRFDSVAADWDANPTRVELAKSVANSIRSTVPLRSGMKAMDFGAGTGLLTLALSPYIGSLTAVDASGEMLRVLEQKLKALRIENVSTMFSDIRSISIAGASYDLIVSSMVLHHIPDVLPVLQHLRLCMKPGGWIALADLDSEDGTFHTDSTGVFHHGFDRSKVCEWLANAGFAKTSAREAYMIIRPSPTGKDKQYGVFLVTGQAD